MANVLTPQLFTILSGLIEERVGIHYGREDSTLLGERIAMRMAEAGFESALDYYYYLRYDDPLRKEMDALTDALVVGETYFFRELEPLEASIRHVIVPAIERRGLARVWCAACASGEEPLSLAMLLEKDRLLDRTRILATDVSPRALSRAREATYGARAMRAFAPDALPPEAHARVSQAMAPWTQPTANGGVRVSKDLVDRITWQRFNLVSSNDDLGTFDLILCRNVLIYFSDATVQRVIERLDGALADDGRLVVGVSESLLRFGTMLTCEERGGAFLYARSAS
jgi:chemotaxis protein methyltransferase CheR